MPTPERKELKSRPVARCSICKKDLPPASFFPSQYGRYVTPSCRACQNNRRATLKTEGYQEAVRRLRGAFDERETWTALEAADVLEYKRLSVGAFLESLRKAGHVERISTGIYRFPSPAVQIVAQATAAAAQPAVPVVAPPPAPGDPFIDAGPYFFALRNIAVVEYDDRGRVSIMLSVQESRPGGHVAPVTYELEGEEAARFISGLSLLRGRPPVELMDRVNALTRERDEARARAAKAEADATAALELAREKEQALNDLEDALSRVRRRAA